MKKALALSLSALLLMCQGCGSSGKKTEDFSVNDSRFKQIALCGNDQYIYIDTETGIEYIVIRNGYWAWGSVLLDENGKPVKKEMEE